MATTIYRFKTQEELKKENPRFPARTIWNPKGLMDHLYGAVVTDTFYATVAKDGQRPYRIDTVNPIKGRLYNWVIEPNFLLKETVLSPKEKAEKDKREKEEKEKREAEEKAKKEKLLASFGTLLERIKQATNEWREDFFSDKKKKRTKDVKAKLSPKVEKIFDFIAVKRLANRDAVLTVVAILLDEERPLRLLGELTETEALNVIHSLPALVAVVPTGNPNGHDYPINIPSVSRGSFSGCIRSNGQVGNNLTDNRDHIRPATEEEIMRMPEAQLKAILKYSPA